MHVARGNKSIRIVEGLGLEEKTGGGVKFQKKLWCCVGGRVIKYYRLSR